MGMLRKRKFRDVYGRKRKLVYPRSTYIDPDVVIDDPDAVSIGAHCQIRRGVVLRAEGGEIVIGDHCTLNHYTVLHAYGGIYVGDWTIIAPHCGLYAQNHNYDSFEEPIARQGSTGWGIYLAGDNWLGSHVVLCDDVTLGRGAIIGANSTVTASVPAGCIAVGSPARIIKKRCAVFCEAGQGPHARGLQDARRPQLANRVLDLLRPEDRVLVVGCGDGALAGLVASKCSQVTGCDYSRDAMYAAGRRFPNARFVYCNPTRLRFEDGAFSVVILLDVVQRLLGPQCRRALSEARRVLAADGRLLLAAPVDARPEDPVDYTELRRFSIPELENLLTEHFENVHLSDAAHGLFVGTRGSEGLPREFPARRSGDHAGTGKNPGARKEPQCTGC